MPRGADTETQGGSQPGYACDTMKLSDTMVACSREAPRARRNRRTRGGFWFFLGMCMGGRSLASALPLGRSPSLSLLVAEATVVQGGAAPFRTRPARHHARESLAAARTDRLNDASALYEQLRGRRYGLIWNPYIHLLLLVERMFDHASFSHASHEIDRPQRLNSQGRATG